MLRWFRTVWCSRCPVPCVIYTYCGHAAMKTACSQNVGRALCVFRGGVVCSKRCFFVRGGFVRDAAFVRRAVVFVRDAVSVSVSHASDARCCSINVPRNYLSSSLGSPHIWPKPSQLWCSGRRWGRFRASFGRSRTRSLGKHCSKSVPNLAGFQFRGAFGRTSTKFGRCLDNARCFRADSGGFRANAGRFPAKFGRV